MADSDAIEFARSNRTGRPNILIIFSDQHNATMAGYRGSKLVCTPNLDRLARNGVVFENAYCNSPLCSPSRQSFMSGLHCHKIGMWNNTGAMPEDTVTWAHMLSLAGYETSLIGKMHFNGYQKMYGFDKRPVLEGNEAGENFYSWGIRASHEWTQPLPYGKKGGGMWPQLMEAGADTPERCPIFQKDMEVLKCTLASLEEKSKQKNGQPWVMCASFVLPHPPWKARADILERYRGKGDLPFNKAGAGRDTCDRSLQQYTGELMNLSDSAIRNAREVYFALISEFDEYCGKILDQIEKSGLSENTVVFYFSDHGEMAGQHGLWSKVTLLESSIRVPLIVNWPGRFAAGKRVRTPVSLVDLFPTFLDIAGIELPRPLSVDGNSLLPLITGAGRFAGEHVFGEFEGEGWNHPRAFLREGRHKLVYNHTAETRLYDLEDDPFEMKDLSAERSQITATMAEKLFSKWDPEKIEQEVLRAQVRRKIARNRNVCKDLGW